MKYIATSHGNYAESTVYTLKMLTGDTIPFICFLENMSKDDLKALYLKKMDEYEGEELIFLVDLFGGTPFNVLIELKYEYPNRKFTIVTGLSLVMLISILESGLEEITENMSNALKIITEIDTSLKAGEEED
ncbi:MAG: PTS sugar transporter subunit IIA [Brevinema sp.]